MVEQGGHNTNIGKYNNILKMCQNNNIKILMTKTILKLHNIYIKIVNDKIRIKIKDGGKRFELF